MQEAGLKLGDICCRMYVSKARPGCLRRWSYSSEMLPLPLHCTFTRSDAAGATMEYAL
jgi:hypothetical protein